MPVCPQCQIAFPDGELHVCAQPRRRLFNQLTVVVPSILVPFDFLVEPVYRGDGSFIPDRLVDNFGLFSAFLSLAVIAETAVAGGLFLVVRRRLGPHWLLGARATPS